MRASDHPSGADSSGLERCGFRLVERKPPIRAVPRALPKLRVVGSSPIARFDESLGDGAFSIALSATGSQADNISRQLRVSHRVDLGALTKGVPPGGAVTRPSRARDHD